MLRGSPDLTPGGVDLSGGHLFLSPGALDLSAGALFLSRGDLDLTAFHLRERVPGS